MNYALVIGRFQPVHSGHVEMLEQIDRMGYDKIILGIGTAGSERNEKNPFTFKEVRQMWEPEIGKLRTATEICDIPDINSKSRYAEHVEKMTGANADDTTVISGNQYTLDCFPGYRHFFFKRVVVFGEEINATKIRELIAQGKEWERYVPKSTVDVIKNISGERIVKEACRVICVGSRAAEQIA